MFWIWRNLRFKEFKQEDRRVSWCGKKNNELLCENEVYTWIRFRDFWVLNVATCKIFGWGHSTTKKLSYIFFQPFKFNYECSTFFSNVSFLFNREGNKSTPSGTRLGFYSSDMWLYQTGRCTVCLFWDIVN